MTENAPPAHVEDDRSALSGSSLAAPNPGRIQVWVAGCEMDWRLRFREAMIQVCVARGLPAELPRWVQTASVRTEGVLLIWPVGADNGPGFAVERRKRKVCTALPDALRSLRIHLPEGVVVSLPAIPYQSPKYGPCLAVLCQSGEFLYRKSSISAMGSLDG